MVVRVMAGGRIHQNERSKRIRVVKAIGQIGEWVGAAGASCAGGAGIFAGDMSELQPLLTILRELVRQPSVVAWEHAFFLALKRELEERGATVKWYEGLMVATGGRPDSITFSAHVDRHGLVSVGEGEFEYAAFVAAQRGDLPGDTISNHLISKIVDRFADNVVWGYEPRSGVYLGRGRITSAFVCPHRDNLVFQIEGLGHLNPNTPVAFEDRVHVEDGRVSAQLDNVLMAAMLVHLFEVGFQGTAMFTAQEESGRSWRFLNEWFLRFGSDRRRLYVLDTSPYPDIDAADAQHVVLRTRDNNASFDEEVTEQVRAICERAGAAYSFKDKMIQAQNEESQRSGGPTKSLGSTELGRLVQASPDVRGTTIQVPTTGYHTTSETASLESVAATLKVLRTLSGC
ncbi:MAG: peptidase M42 [Planctomycetota bacterium]